MLSYRHSYHAGNPSDVLKHIMLIYCLDYMTQKPKPLLCIDTHAGAGLYKTEESNEYNNGAGRLRAYKTTGGRSVPDPVKKYLNLLDDHKDSYPGSPLLAARILREQDRLVCFELHPKDYEELEKNAKIFDSIFNEPLFVQKNSGKKSPKIETRKEDGPLSLKALLPPVSGRGLILIDPAWEEKDEYSAIPMYVSAAAGRFSQGVYLVWYPILTRPKVPDTTPIAQTLLDIYSGNRCRVELYFPAATGSDSPRGMTGCGLVILNPPWTLKQELTNLLPFLAAVFNEGRTDRWYLDWKE